MSLTMDIESGPKAVPEKTVESTPDVSSDSDFSNAFKTFRRKEVPIKLVWTDIEYSVNGSGPKKKTILQKISGEANPGEVVALMGVSSENPKPEILASRN
jgi:hypothetical protein